jgi:hypothetical protein
MYVWDFSMEDNQLLMHTKGNKKQNMDKLKNSILLDIENALKKGRKGIDRTLYCYGHEVFLKEKFH